jgi:cytochrome c oxidase cbb3-type subunit 3
MHMSDLLSWYVIVLTLANILGCFWLIAWATRRRPGEAREGEVMGHKWDGDLEEYNNPLPRWWLWLFYITIGFSLVYLALYPGLGRFQGMLNWSAAGQYGAEVKAAGAQYGPLFRRFAETNLVALAGDPQAQRTGRRLFLNYCASCHGSDAAGGAGYPNLTDRDWLWGGTPEAIKASIRDGRSGVMPAHAAVLGEHGVEEVATYVEKLAGRKVDEGLASLGKLRFEQLCAACHGAAGSGDPALGAANLTDGVWLYGGSPQAIRETIAKGRTGVMPAHRDFLGEEKVHLLAAYVYGLSRQK